MALMCLPSFSMPIRVDIKIVAKRQKKGFSSAKAETGLYFILNLKTKINGK